ncbi:MAG: hypothetical protein MK078_02035 [Crocinitomicaceae bacterium]|nr:hypothetical protein [Crocinitomicaceae bacterium]
MLGSLIKRKLDADKMANVFVNAFNEVIESGFDEVAEMINEDPAFIDCPQINKNYEDAFLMIVLAGNLRFFEDHFSKQEEIEIKQLIEHKFAAIYDMNAGDFDAILSEYDSFISRVNHPSKNTLYGMSKAVFHKFKLNNFQEEYFKNLNTPNPLFLKRMDDIITNFLWDWEQFFKKHKLNIA